MQVHGPSPFKLPENPKGIQGLAQILNYCLYQKILREEALGIEDAPEKLTRVTRKLQKGFKSKIREMAEIRTLIQTAREQKKDLLDHLLEENNFKVQPKAKDNKEKNI
jgi:hypothetical protein